ncbi:peptidoglycan recognition protein family protein [Streptomyces corynorhini]|uniref:N-acetylmuramoyl-L-alanine amidase n=1 Tax=Streptomyces corynorhini TaxID=2282652 RepID=A0A370BCS3_9ACTN|nr:peptidoglycan recognition protein [Streptomyces corynorhini]RDG39560.1 N-acetylmuramoyl-L-alanine amidase [Streptomyces corynorhini]
MRAYLATSIGVACTAALLLPLSQPSDALAAPGPATAPDQPHLRTGAAAVPGSTQSLPLTPLATRRSPDAAREQGVARRDVRPFSLLGVVWDDADAEFHGTVQVRTRATATHVWSDWQDLETHNQEHGADPGTQERDSGTVHGSTAPLWVGGSDGVELRVRAVQEDGESGPPRALLPRGLRLELIDPGEEPADTGGTDAVGKGSTGEAGGTADSGATGPLAEAERAPAAPMSLEESDTSAANEGLVTLGAREIPALTKAEAEAEVTDTAARKYAAPRPRIVTRRGWGADESLREKRFGYTSTVKAAFVHHSATGNNYTCKEAPSVLRSIYRYHVRSSGWRDFGYNFAIDKCGNIYEGRAGGVARPVLGAHTLGFNTNTVGIAVLGTYSGTNPPEAATTAVAQLTAWKLGLHGVNPKGKVTLTSGGSGKYAKGTRVGMNTISGHRDGFSTECPGSRLYGRLGTVRAAAARYQGR